MSVADADWKVEVVTDPALADFKVEIVGGTAEPGGAAGGALGGTYPDPTLSAAKQAEIDAKATTAALTAAIAAAALVVATTQTADYVLALADGGTVVEMNKASAVNVTVPLNATVAFPVGTVIEVFQLGAGQVTIAFAGGVTLDAPFGKKTTAQYTSAFLRKRATDEWVVFGDLTT